MKPLRYLLTLMLCSAGTSLAQSEAFQAMMTEAFLPLSSMISAAQEKFGNLKCGAPDLKMGDGPENAAGILSQLARSKGWSLLTKAEVVGGTGYLFKTKTQFVFASISVSGYIAYESCDAPSLTKPQVPPAKPPSTPAKPPTSQGNGTNPPPQTYKPPPPPPPGVLYDPTYHEDPFYKNPSIESRLLALAERAKRQNIFPRRGQVNISPEASKLPCDLSKNSIIGHVVGAFTQPHTKQFAFMYASCAANNGESNYTSVGLVIMQQNRVVHHSIFAYSYYPSLQMVPDLNNDGLDELMLIDTLLDQHRNQTMKAYILNANTPTLRTLYAFDVTKSSCISYNISPQSARETLIRVKRGKRPVFTGDIYLNDCYESRKLIARNQLIKPTGQVLRIYGKAPLEP